MILFSNKTSTDSLTKDAYDDREAIPTAQKKKKGSSWHELNL